MSNRDDAMVCRRCREEIPVAAGNCPHCGVTIRSRLPLVVILLFGLILMVASLLALSKLLFFGVLGLLLAMIAGYLLYDRHKRIEEARGGEEPP